MMDLEHLKERIVLINDQLVSLQNKLDYYDITKQYFKVGDKVWTYGRNQPESGTVVEIQDFRKYIDDGGCVYYWVQMDSVTTFEKVIELIKFYSWLYLFRCFGFRQPRINPKFGPGHALAPGDEMFSTKLEALVSMKLGYTISELDELRDELNLEEKSDTNV